MARGLRIGPRVGELAIIGKVTTPHSRVFWVIDENRSPRFSSLQLCEEGILAHIGRLFNNLKKDEILLVYDRVQELQQITEPVGKDGYRLLTGQLEPGDQAEIRIFNQPVMVSGQVGIDTFIRPSDAAVDVFDTGELHSAAENRSLAVLDLRGSFDVQTATFQPESSLVLDGRAAASGEVRYRHWLPVSNDQQRLSALKRVVTGSRLPQLLTLANLAPGEVHRLDTRLKLGFGLELRRGNELSIDEMLEPFRELDLRLQAHVQFSIEASLGWSFYDEMSLTIGRACTLHKDPHWVRIRLDRQQRRRLTIGARFDLDLRYDLATSLESIFNRALNLLPGDEMLDTFREINRLVKDGDWSDVQARLNERAADLLSEYLESTGWRDWLKNSKEVEDLLALSNQVVDLFGDLDERLRDGWADVLATSHLSPDSKIVQTLEKLAALDLANFSLTDLLSEDWRDTIAVFELFTGQELESLLLANNQVLEQAVQRAKSLASQALAVLRQAPDRFLTRLRQISAANHVLSVADFLSANATTPEALEQAIENAVRPRIRRLVERLTGKAFAEIDLADLARIQRWAQKIDQLFTTQESWEARIRREIERLRGEVGFAVGLEFDRLTESSALLDFEIHPTHTAIHRMVEETLPAGDARRIISRLAEIDADNDQPDFQIREAVFFHRRVRTTTLWVSFFGRQQSENRRLSESTIRVLPGTDGQARRQATYDGAFLRSEATQDALAWEAGAILHSEAAGSGYDLTQPYDTCKHALHLTFTRHDAKTFETELDALDALLGNLGFRQPFDEPLRDQTPAHVETRFSLELALPELAIEAFVSDLNHQSSEDRWNLDVLGAAHRWYQEGLMQRVPIDFHPFRLGLVLAELLHTPDFRRHWQPDVQTLETWARRASVPVNVQGKVFPCTLFTGTVERRWRSDFVSLRDLSARRRPGMTAARDLRRALLAVKDRRPATLERLHRQAAARFQRMQAVLWPNPMYLWWLMLARISRLSPDALREVQGFAALRYRSDTQAEWSIPRFWPLRDGLPLDLLTGLFSQH